jgi:hypothetical protein
MRVLWRVVTAIALLATACTAGSPPAPTPAGGTTGAPTSADTATASPAASDPEPVGALAAAACESTSREVLLRTWRGVMLGRSGDLQLIPFPDAFVSGGLTHSTPFDYTQEVPLFLYGPGYIRPGVYDRAVTLADVAPTTGAILDFPFEAPDGEAQRQALLPGAAQRPPRLVVTLVWDSAGTDVLEMWQDSWPYLRSLSERGAWFTRASVGASPSNTPTGHASIGTGAFPSGHGMVDEYISVNGKIQKPNENGPAFMVLPTLADLYDRAMGNEPKVGAIATLSAHIMMMGHGSQWSGGDRDIAVAREKEDAATGGDDSAVSWNLTSDMAPFYEMPSYVNQLPDLTAFNEELDRADGALDGRWRDHEIARLHGGFDTPARTPYQTQLIREVILREGFGDDEVPDLLYLNYKAIDVVGHLFSANGIEMSDAVRTQDEHLRILVRLLNEEVGRGRWVLVLTADHGTQYDPEVSGFFRIDIDRLEQQIAGRFDDGDDRPLIERMRVTEIWLDDRELAENGHSLEGVARFIAGLTQADTIKQGTAPEPGREREPVFSAVLPSSMLSALPCLPEARNAS